MEKIKKVFIGLMLFFILPFWSCTTDSELFVSENSSSNHNTMLKSTPIPTSDVVNGCFETGSLYGWTGTGSHYNCVDNSQYAGNYCGYVWGPGTLEQTVTGLQPNTTYALKAMCKLGSGVSYLGVKDYGGADVTTTVTSTSYTLVTRTFTTGSTNTTAKIYWSNPSGQNSWIDNVRITPVVINADFETGSLANSWTGWGSYYCVNNSQYAGNYCGYVWGPGALEQIVKGLKPNTTYTVKAMCKVGSGSSQLTVADYGGTQLSASTSSTVYTEKSITFTTGPTNSTAKISWYNPSGQNAWIDNVTIAPQYDDWALVFVDNFDGTSVNTSNWCLYDCGGHNNNGLRKPSAITVANGILTITAKMLNETLISGAMSNLKNYTYGKFEFRVKADADYSGVTSAVVLTWPQTGIWPNDGENDIFETHSSSNPSRAYFETNILSGAPNNSWSKGHYVIDATQWHVVAMEWMEDYIKIYIDDNLVWTLSDPTLIVDQPHHLCIQLDAFNPTMTGTSKMYIDWVKIYQPPLD